MSRESVERVTKPLVLSKPALLNVPFVIKRLHLIYILTQRLILSRTPVVHLFCFPDIGCCVGPAPTTSGILLDFEFHIANNTSCHVNLLNMLKELVLMDYFAVFVAG
jgi:hypothetical protein